MRSERSLNHSSAIVQHGGLNVVRYADRSRLHLGHAHDHDGEEDRAHCRNGDHGESCGRSHAPCHSHDHVPALRVKDHRCRPAAGRRRANFVHPRAGGDPYPFPCPCPCRGSLDPGRDPDPDRTRARVAHLHHRARTVPSPGAARGGSQRVREVLGSRERHAPDLCHSGRHQATVSQRLSSLPCPLRDPVLRLRRVAARSLACHLHQSRARHRSRPDT
mmetsp:Transcript_11513/g.31067  ORF Transcript_11513/g.31067 Transcript_11513/m.31067 type:complete len:218 (-) Transcript_11513:751-1404(-)